MSAPGPDAPPAPASPGPWAARHFPLILILLFWLCLNCLTANRYPCAWLDEVSYADPAINLVLHGKWVSTAWYAQGPNDFWAGNVPLYPALLALWLKVFGVSITAVRSLNYLLFALLAIVIYAMVLKLAARGNRSRSAAILFTLLLLCGYGLIFNYRSGRPDVLCMLVVAFPTLAWIARWRYRVAIVFLSAFILPWAGVQVLSPLVVTTLFLLLIDWREFLPVFLAAGFGSTCGLAALLAFYAAHGVFHAFFGSLFPHTFMNTAKKRFYPKDFSFMILLAGAIFAQVVSAVRGGPRFRAPLALGILLSLAIGVTLYAVGMFPTYYGWMTYIPLLISVAIAWTSRDFDPIAGTPLKVAFIFILLVGPVLHLCSAVYDWPYRDPSLPGQLIARNLKTGDVAYGDPASYYALLMLGTTPYVGPFLDIMTPQEKNRTSILIIKPQYYDEVTSMIGGSWKQVDQYIPPRIGFLGTRWNMGFLSNYNYELIVFRRTGATR